MTSVNSQDIDNKIKRITNADSTEQKLSLIKGYLNELKKKMTTIKSGITDFLKTTASVKVETSAEITLEGLSLKTGGPATPQPPLTTGNKKLDKEIAAKWEQLIKLRELLEQYKLFMSVLSDNVEHTSSAQSTLTKAEEDYNNILKEVKILTKGLQEIAKTVIPTDLRELGIEVLKHLQEIFKGRHTEKRLRYEVAAGLDGNGSVLFSMYLLFRDLTDDEGLEYDTYQVVLTKSNMGIHLNRFTGSKTKPPGSFPLGPTVTNVNDSVAIIDNWLAADSFVSIVHPRPIAFKSEDFKFKEHVKNVTVENNVIKLELDNTVTKDNIEDVKTIIRGKLTTIVRTRSRTSDLMKIRTLNKGGKYTLEILFVVSDDYKGQHVSPLNWQKLSELVPMQYLRKLRDYLENEE